MQIQLKGFYLKEEAAPNNGQRSYTVMDRKGTVKALVIPETNKEGELCNYLIINLSSVPRRYAGTKIGLINSLKLSQEELDSFELWWAHGIINQLSKPDQEITFNVGESGPMVIIDGFKYTFDCDFKIMVNSYSNNFDELIEIYCNVFDEKPSVVKEIFERIQTYLDSYAVTPLIDPAYGVFEVPDGAAPAPAEQDVKPIKMRFTITNLKTMEIKNLVGLVYNHLPKTDQLFYTEIDPKSIKIIHGELKENLDVHTNHIKDEYLYVYGDQVATFRRQTFGLLFHKDVGNYTLDFCVYIPGSKTIISSNDPEFIPEYQHIIL